MAQSIGMMGILKHDTLSDKNVQPAVSGTSTLQASRVLKASIMAARADAERICANAHGEADALLDVARQKAQEIEQNAQDALKSAFEDAKARGFNEGKAKAAQQWSSAIADSAKATAAFEAQIVPQLKSIAVTIAKKILGTELKQHPEQVLDIIRQALAEKARHRSQVALRVHPEDYKLVREHRAELAEVLSRCKDIIVREDDSITLHGVIIETDAGTIDAQLDTQLAIFEKVLTSQSTGG